MLVTFRSSETGELMMFADVARQLLVACGKECTARGTFTPAEMQPAADRLRRAIELGEAPPPVEESKEKDEDAPPPISLGRRAWPLLDMLERTGRSGPKAHVVWEAATDF